MYRVGMKPVLEGLNVERHCSWFCSLNRAPHVAAVSVNVVWLVILFLSNTHTQRHPSDSVCGLLITHLSSMQSMCHKWKTNKQPLSSSLTNTRLICEHRHCLCEIEYCVSASLWNDFLQQGLNISLSLRQLLYYWMHSSAKDHSLN